MPPQNQHGDHRIALEQPAERLEVMTARNGAYVDTNEHSYWGDAHDPPLFEALLNWVERGHKPTPASIADRCRQLRAAQPADCRFLPDFAPKPLASRIVPR